MTSQKLRRPSRDGRRSISPKLKFEVLSKSLEGKNYKQIAHELKTSFQSVYDARKAFPLFFWKRGR